MDSLSTRPGAIDQTPSATIIGYLKAVRLAAAVGWTLLIMTLCWLPKTVVHHVEGTSSWFQIHHFDKAVHCAIFVVFTLLWARVWSSRGGFVRVGLLGLGLAVLTELVQIVPMIGRDASVGDGATDLLGVVFGLALVPWLEPLFRSIEKRVFGESTV